MRRDDRPRVLGPYYREDRQQWRITTVDPRAATATGRKRDRYFATEQEAQEFKELKQEQLVRLESITIEAAIESYGKYLSEDKGTIGSGETVRRLRAFFPDLALPLGRMAPDLCKEYYEAFRQREHCGRKISVSYHRATLINARSLFKWCVGKGWVRVNPLASVEGVGKRNRGKMKHTGNEVRKLYAHIFPLAETGDCAALGVLSVLTMALRSSDLTRRLVRDVDLDATQLNISIAKTEMSEEPRVIPDALRPLFRRLVEGRDAFEPLFKTPYTKSGHHTRRWLEEAMRRFCAAAGVPYVCPHALKGTAGNILAKRGELGNRIAEYLSHEDESTTFKHYVDREIVEQAERGRALTVIQGGRG